MFSTKAIFLLAMLLSIGMVYGNNELSIFDKKTASAIIVIPENPSKIELVAAAELAYHLNKATGVTFAVYNENKIPADVKVQICLGNTISARNAEINTSALKPGGFILKTSGNCFFLAGCDGIGKEEDPSTPAGTLFAVYHWLQHSLGVKWLWPGPSGEVIPELNIIRVPDINEKIEPAFDFVMASKFNIKSADYNTRVWSRRVMRVSDAGMFKIAGTKKGHAWQDWAQLYGKTNPDWFGMSTNEKRQAFGNSMCISNSEFQDKVVELWWDVQKNNKTEKFYINCKENDTTNRCCCPECIKNDGKDVRGPTGRYNLYKNVGERYASFYIDIQEKARKFDPDACVTAYAYQSYFYAPRNVKLNKNVVIGLVPDIPFPRPLEYQKWVKNEIELWKLSGATLYSRPNYFLGGYCMPEVWAEQYADEFKWEVKNGIIGLLIDGPNCSWATMGFNIYIMARLAVEPNLTVDIIADEFYDGFGPAKNEIRKYFEYWREYVRKNTGAINSVYENSAKRWYFHGFHYASYVQQIFPLKALEESRNLLDNAMLAAGSEQQVKDRISFLRAGLENAVHTVNTAIIFNKKTATFQERKNALDDLRAFRKTLPPYVIDEKFISMVEENCWKLNTPVDKDAVELPEYWKIKSDTEQIGKIQKWFEPKFSDENWVTASTWKILEAQGFRDYIYMWYRTSVMFLEKNSNKVFLRLGAVDESCWVWINGKPIGELIYDASKNPNSWQDPVDFEITDFINYGVLNQITVLVENKSGDGGLWKPSYIIFKK